MKKSKTSPKRLAPKSFGPLPLALLIFLVFLFRLGFGLCESHWPDQFEQFQHYLVGLKFYTTGLWPYFGADMFASESGYHSQVPGALHGLFVGLPFYLLPIPEAPFILVNLFSTAGVALLAWYIHLRLPSLSFPWLLLWIAVVPWSLNYSTNVYNMSYLMLPSVLFFIGFLESIPLFSLGKLNPRTANALMGFGLLWIVQFHFSYILLLPFAALSLFLQVRKGKNLSAPLFFALGALIPLAFLVPTFLQYGFTGGKTSAGLVFLSALNWDNLASFPVILARYLSLVCSEIPRWIGAHTKDRLDFLASHPLILVPGAILWIGGWAQFVALLYGGLNPKGQGPHWKALKLLTAGAFFMVWGSFWFTVKRPLSHQYLILFPLIMTYSCYVWAQFKDKKNAALIAKAFILISILFQAGFALAVAPKDSIWTQRALVQQAIDQKDYRLLGERREGSFY